MKPERHGFFDDEFAYLELFEGVEVICVYWDCGKLKGYKGILKEVNAYDNIVIENTSIKFLGEKTAIKCIIYDDTLVLYSNPKLDNYTGHKGHFYHLIKLQKNNLGYSVIEENIKEILDRKNLRFLKKHKK